MKHPKDVNSRQGPELVNFLNWSIESAYFNELQEVSFFFYSSTFITNAEIALKVDIDCYFQLTYNKL